MRHLARFWQYRPSTVHNMWQYCVNWLHAATQRPPLERLVVDYSRVRRHALDNTLPPTARVPWEISRQNRAAPFQFAAPSAQHCTCT